MNDESFNLLTKLYAEFSSFRDETANKLTAIDNRTIMIKNEHGKKIEAAIDGYKQVYEKLLEHDKRFDSIDEKLSLHDLQIEVLRKNA
jgi:hypothetical protein